ncbi:Spy/CpxP family protein refolding chaperone [Bradyrhizobium prioriisuperbiae]|uniref:Spy/CpxP family protein refolding chaperone n=1 Tax=Bradyrhizobium prioriisuperbiae TaxID=2854389 RepID=UPI0028EDC86E|nr:Spy/CpxP family protein refolding chaperone [Bradyrhizobium prioritasuperba]
MKKIILAGVAAAALAGSTAVYAQHRGWDGDRGSWRHSRMSAEDRLAFVDARIAAVKAGLKLTAEQEKNWPAIESAVRDFAKQRIDRANASTDTKEQQDPIARLRERSDRMAATAAGLKKIADAADPLYKTLDEGQKRRLTFLTRMGGHHHGGWREHFRRGGDRDFDSGGDRGRGPDRDDGPSRL